MHTIKITPNLLFEYQCTSGKFIELPNRIESKIFGPNWNALPMTRLAADAERVTTRAILTILQVYLEIHS